MPDSHLLPRMVCVVVNWNGWRDTLECLDSLRLQDYPNLGVIVVDNGSTNDSTARLRAAHPWVEMVELPQNIGFSSGCNAGTRLACQGGADYIWLLNNDTVAPPSTASAIVRAALAHPGAGAIGCVLHFMHDPARVQAWGGGRIHLGSAFITHFTSPASFSAPSTFFTGASLTLPRWVCEQVGIFYEGFFMYCDDTTTSVCACTAPAFLWSWRRIPLSCTRRGRPAQSAARSSTGSPPSRRCACSAAPLLRRSSRRRSFSYCALAIVWSGANGPTSPRSAAASASFLPSATATSPTACKSGSISGFCALHTTLRYGTS